MVGLTRPKRLDVGEPCTASGSPWRCVTWGGAGRLSEKADTPRPCMRLTNCPTVFVDTVMTEHAAPTRPYRPTPAMACSPCRPFDATHARFYRSIQIERP